MLCAALQVVGSLPRVLRDIESLGHEVSVLRNQMNSVRQDIEKVRTNRLLCSFCLTSKEGFIYGGTFDICAFVL